MSRTFTGQYGKPTPASVYKRGLGIPVFRCDLCGRWMNQSQKREWDGLWVCSQYCATITSPSELDALWAEQQSQIDSWEPNERPITHGFSGGVGINERDPVLVEIGTTDSADLDITGFGLSSADVFSFERAELSGIAVYTSTAAATITISSVACPIGDFWFKYAGTKYHRMIRVR